MSSETQWLEVRLGDYTTVKARLGWKGLKADEYVEDGYIFLATPNLKGHQIDFHNVDYITKWRYDESPEIQLRLGDVLIVKDGSTLGICNYVRRLPRPTTVNGSIAVVRTNESLDSEFLFHFVNGDDFQKLITLKKSGLGVPHLFQADLRDFPVSLPSLPEQKKIARILTTLDKLIEKTGELVSKYQSVRQGMMDDLFARGVEEDGSLRPSQTDAPQLYKESELGWIPKEWSSESLGQYTTVKARLGWKGLKADEYVEEGFIFLATPNLKGFQIDFRDVNYISKWRYEESPEIQLRVGDVLIVKDGSTLGICSFVSHLPRPTTVNGSIAVVRSKDGLEPEFLFHFVRGTSFQELIRLKKSGLGVPHLFQADLRDFPIALPPISEQVRIAKRLSSIESLIQENARLYKDYRQVKSGLMQDLLTGRVRVKADEAEEVAAHA